MKNLLSFVLLLMATAALGQDAANYINQSSNFNTLSDGVGQFDYIYKKKPELPGVDGSPYWYDADMEGVVFVKGKRTSFKSMKYDVLQNQLEISESGLIKALNVIKADSFWIVDAIGSIHSFINPSSISGEILWDRFVEVMEKGELVLFRRSEANVKPPTYDQALMVGNKNSEIQMKRTLYLCKNGQCGLIRNKGDFKHFLKSVGIVFDRLADPREETDFISWINSYNKRK